jgi:hypothetical protein
MDKKKTDGPHELAADEVREKLLSHIWGMIDYWDKESRAETTRAKMEGLAFSILTALDGGSCALPGFVVAPSPHESDIDFHKEHGENWYPPFEEDHVCDIGGSLHDHFHKFGRKHGFLPKGDTR